MRRIFCLLAAVTFGLAVMTGCAPYPKSNIEQSGPSSSISLAFAPPGARLLLDGSDVGEAAAFDGRAKVLAVPPGKHRVKVVLGDRELLDKEIFVGSGSSILLEAVQ